MGKALNLCRCCVLMACLLWWQCVSLLVSESLCMKRLHERNTGNPHLREKKKVQPEGSSVLVA